MTSTRHQTRSLPVDCSGGGAHDTRKEQAVFNIPAGTRYPKYIKSTHVKQE